MKNKKNPDFIKNAQAKLLEHFNAQVSEKAISILASKGFIFDTTQELFSFFKYRVKSFTSSNGETKLAVDDIPFMAYKMPNFKQKGFDITISLEYVEL